MKQFRRIYLTLVQTKQREHLLLELEEPLDGGDLRREGLEGDFGPRLTSIEILTVPP